MIAKASSELSGWHFPVNLGGGMEVTDEQLSKRHRQMRLLSMGANSLSTKLGAEFFRRLPAKPGVYFFHDKEGKLLYIGQSNDLRARVGSYRHVSPERHPRRTLRLVHRIARAEWQECLTAADAIELERVLLLEKRPPFNRAGVWPGFPWWLTVNATPECLAVALSRQPSTHAGCTGPLPSAFRYAYASLMRCIYRLSHPHRHFAQWPLGLLNSKTPLSIRFEIEDAEPFAHSIISYAQGRAGELLSRLETIGVGATLGEQEFWKVELESLQKFALKKKPAPAQEAIFEASPLPLFPDL